MQQSNYIFGALFIAFFVFITAKGELPVYIGFLKGQGAASQNTSASAGTQETAIGTLPNEINGAQVYVQQPSNPAEATFPDLSEGIYLNTLNPNGAR